MAYLEHHGMFMVEKLPGDWGWQVVEITCFRRAAHIVSTDIWPNRYLVNNYNDLETYNDVFDVGEWKIENQEWRKKYCIQGKKSIAFYLQIRIKIMNNKTVSLAISPLLILPHPSYSLLINSHRVLPMINPFCSGARFFLPRYYFFP